MIIVSLIMGILQIILFFKVWGMTNDVNELKLNYQKTNCIFGEESDKQQASSSDLKRLLLLGNKEAYKSAAITNFIKKAEFYNANNFGVPYLQKHSIRPLIEELQKQLAFIDEKVPESIDKMQTLYDYHTLLNKEESKPTENTNKE